MLPSLPVAEFLQPEPRSRAYNAVARALELKPDVKPIGEYHDERYYRVKSAKRDRHCVIIWTDRVSGEPVVRCDCEAFLIPQAPTHCYHTAAVLIWEANNDEPTPTTGEERAETPVPINRRRQDADKVKRRRRGQVR